MSRNSYKNFRVGAFAAVNNGEILGCSTNVLFRTKYSGSGFVYDNSGTVKHSVAAKPAQGSGKVGGFFYRNTGIIEECGFISKARATGGEQKKKSAAFRDEKLRIEPSVSAEEIYRILKLDSVWKNERQDSLEPDFAANRAEEVSISPVEIGDAETLLSVIEAINDGDSKAAEGHYILTKNINLHGRKIDPIGDSETTAFSGLFDGNGKKISNFVVNGKGREYAGFFGYTKNAVVVNLKVDYILKGTGGNVTGGMVGICDGGRFENCAVFADVTPGICGGGFVGKNAGSLINCYVCGKVHYPILLWPLFLALGLLFLLSLITVTLRQQGSSDVYVPEVIDPNQVPVVNNNKVDPPQAGTSRISFEVYQEVFVSAATMVGKMEYVNPARATQDVVIHICVSDSELVKAGYDLAAAGVRTAEELADPGYDPAVAYTELYRSGRIQIGFGVDNCKLSPLPGGETLKVGDYEMVIMIDSYDPETNEKAIVNAQVPITVHIVEG